MGIQNSNRLRVIVFVLLFSMFAQWIRWLPVYLSSVTVEECEVYCSDTPFTPLCQSCNEDDTGCNDCHNCRIEYDTTYLNLMDGVCMSTNEYGILTGIGFSMTFGVFGLIAGIFVDLTNENVATIFGISTLVTGILTVVSSYCHNFMQIVLLRALLGALQAFGAPSSVYLITSTFQKDSEKPYANASYTIGLYLGAGLASLSTMLSTHMGWQNVSRLVGYSTIVVAIIYEILHDNIFSNNSNIRSVASVPENTNIPKNAMAFSQKYNNGSNTKDNSIDLVSYFGDDKHILTSFSKSVDDSETESDDGKSTTSFFSAIGFTRIDSSSTDDDEAKFLLSNSNPAYIVSSEIQQSCIESDFDNDSNDSCVSTLFRSLTNKDIPAGIPLLYVGSCLRFMASIVTFVYVPVLISRRFPEYETTFSYFNAIVILTCGSVSSFLGGRAGQVAVKLYGLSGLARLIILSCIFSLVPFLTAFTTPSFWICMMSLVLGYLVGEAWLGAAMALLQALAPKSRQGISMSLFLFFNWNLAALGTDILGLIDPGTDRISLCMAAIVAMTIIGSIIIFYILDERLVTLRKKRRLQRKGDDGLPSISSDTTESSRLAKDIMLF